MEKNTLWIWRAIDGVSRRALSWKLGNRSDKDLKTLVDKVDNGRCTFMRDEWEGFFRILPQERHLYGKDLTFPIESTNSDIRHRLARFKRKTKATSRSADMVHKTLKRFHFFQDNTHHVASYMAPLIAFFS